MKLALILMSLALVSFVYFYWVRPTLAVLPHFKEMYDDANGFWQNLWVKVRAYWDLIVSGLLIVGPELPDLLSAISGADLESFIPSATAKAITTIAGLSSMLIRAFVMRQTAAK